MAAFNASVFQQSSLFYHPTFCHSLKEISCTFTCKEQKRKKLFFRVRSGGEQDLPPSSSSSSSSPQEEMTLDKALRVLGVKEDASFDDILSAKKRIVAKSGGDATVVREIESAYDLLLMQSLSRRRAGNVVASGIRYADVKKPKLPNLASSGSAPAWMSSLAVRIATPAQNDLALYSAVYAVLATWTYFSGLDLGAGDEGDLYSSVSSSASESIPGVQVALALGASLYFQTKENGGKLGKSALIASSFTILGIVLGSLAESWLHVEVFPLLGISSPGVLISEFAFLSLWAATAFVRL